MFSGLIKRDIKTAWKGTGAAAHGVAFFGMSYALMVMAFSPEQMQLIRQPLLAICMLLTVMLTLPSFLDDDVRDGSLEQYLLLPLARSWLMLAKMMAYWFAFVLPVLLLALLIQYAEEGNILPLRLVLMPLWLVPLGGISAALACMHGRGMMARALIIIPLYLPALIAATLLQDNAAMLFIQAGVALILWPFAAWVGGFLLGLIVE